MKESKQYNILSVNEFRICKNDLCKKSFKVRKTQIKIFCQESCSIKDKIIKRAQRNKELNNKKLNTFIACANKDCKEMFLPVNGAKYHDISCSLEQTKRKARKEGQKAKKEIKIQNKKQKEIIKQEIKICKSDLCNKLFKIDSRTTKKYCSELCRSRQSANRQYKKTTFTTNLTACANKDCKEVFLPVNGAKYHDISCSVKYRNRILKVNNICEYKQTKPVDINFDKDMELKYFVPKELSDKVFPTIINKKTISIYLESCLVDKRDSMYEFTKFNKLVAMVVSSNKNIELLKAKMEAVNHKITYMGLTLFVHGNCKIIKNKLLDNYE